MNLLQRSVGQLEPALEGGCKARHRSCAFSAGTSAPKGNDQSATRPWRIAPTSPPEGVCRHMAWPLRGWAGELVSASTGRTRLAWPLYGWAGVRVSSSPGRAGWTWPIRGWTVGIVSSSPGRAGRPNHSPPTLRVGRNLHEHRRAGGPFVSSTRDRCRGGPLSRSGQPAEVVRD